jgi:16S rRNA (cytosine967-C5)-methyltransferase
VGPAAIARSLGVISTEAPGLAARRVAADILENVLHRRRPLDEQLADEARQDDFSTLPERDRALVRAVAARVLRRLGTLRHLCAAFLERGLPPGAPRVETALLIGAAQILWFDVPDHAAVDLAVRLVQADARTARYAGLVNAVLRRVIRDGAKVVAQTDAAVLDAPPWLMARWIRSYGQATAHAIAAAHRGEPALDFSVKANPQHWAEELRGCLLPTGSVRAVVHGAAALLPGYAQGAWWVQDAAAALPVRLLDNVAGRAVADLCAAPGGKTAQLAAAGANVVAVDRAERRLERLKQNLARLDLRAEIVQADVLKWRGRPFDAVVLDAPCSSTGTIRRHPDIPWIKRESDITALASLQRRLIAHAAELVKPGGLLIYCTCSLELEEGVEIVHDLLASGAPLVRRPILPGEAGIPAEWLTAEGELRTLPCHLPHPDLNMNPNMAGIDGFYAARLQRT